MQLSVFFFRDWCLAAEFKFSFPFIALALFHLLSFATLLNQDEQIEYECLKLLYW
jgi:hypothetical protein